MDTRSYKTKSLNKDTVEKKWVLVDAEDQVVGRLTSRIAAILRGKHKPGFTPHVDCGDNVIVINADKVRFTGKKYNDKEYVKYTGYPGGQRRSTPAEVMRKDPRRIIEYAVKGMLPKNRLGRKLFNNLYVYSGSAHPHEAQKPETINI